MPDSRCGIHITVDISDFDATDRKRLIIAFLKAQKHFYSMCNASRQNNSYCKKYDINKLSRCVAARSVSKIRSILYFDKYRGLNLTKLNQDVVEFRMFQSELSARKITEWVRTCVGFVEGVKQTQVTFTTASLFTKQTFKGYIKPI